MQTLDQLDRMKSYACQKEGQARMEEMALLRKQIKRLRERKEELLGNNRRKQKVLFPGFVQVLEILESP